MVMRKLCRLWESLWTYTRKESKDGRKRILGNRWRANLHFLVVNMLLQIKFVGIFPCSLNHYVREGIQYAPFRGIDILDIGVEGFI